MNADINQELTSISRRSALKTVGGGLGAMALGSMLSRDGQAQDYPLLFWKDMGRYLLILALLPLLFLFRRQDA